MKAWILAVVMFAGITLNAQERERKHEKLTAEQKTELQVKELTLKLDLNEKQQKDFQKLILEKNKQGAEAREKIMNDRKAGKEISKDDRFAMRKQMLDEQIAMKKEVKKILTAEQYDKWEKMAETRKENMSENIKKHHDKKLKQRRQE